MVESQISMIVWGHRGLATRDALKDFIQQQAGNSCWAWHYRVIYILELQLTRLLK